ncbi:hypothetical protein AAH979_21575 [Plantactinospora sp. ZYX-F-223]|uniref:hypothetical protein n=1 Tax=Plantactinospora sp. ZYX-F-223 TaxID=3144103 RepID=UPI0031FC4EA4
MDWGAVITAGLTAIGGVTTLAVRASGASRLRADIKENIELAKQLESDFPHMKDEALALESLASRQLLKLGEMQSKKVERKYDWSTLIVGVFFSIPLGILAWWLWSQDNIGLKIAGIVTGLVVLLIIIGTIGATFSPSKKTEKS